jgi:hypothetical protein
MCLRIVSANDPAIAIASHVLKVDTKRCRIQWNYALSRNSVGDDDDAQQQQPLDPMYSARPSRLLVDRTWHKTLGRATSPGREQQWVNGRNSVAFSHAAFF